MKEAMEEEAASFGAWNTPSSEPIVYKDVSIVAEHGETITDEKIAALNLQQRVLDRKRREEFDKLIDLKGSIRVFCRVRPSRAIDNWKRPLPVSSGGQEKITISVAGARKDFTADRVFHQDTSQEEVFQEVKPIIRSALDGHNVCVLAYGQTGTGKTHTMEGTTENPGIVPRTIDEMFIQASRDNSATYKFSLSMLEVYMGSLRDLLAQKQQKFVYQRVNTAASASHSNLNILASSTGNVEVEGLTDVPVSDTKSAVAYYSRGRRTRSTAWTNVNESSSRSHCLTRITVRRCGADGEVTTSKLWLVDLGGSERLLKTGATGLIMEEGRSINLSLSALGDVIAALRRKKGHVPYRNSKLTQILSDSLGEGSKVLLIIHLSPDEDDLSETVYSLAFARRAKCIESRRELSEDAKRERLKAIAERERVIQGIEEELQRLRAQIEKAQTLLIKSTKSQQLPKDPRLSPRSTLAVGHMEVSSESIHHHQIAEKPRSKSFSCSSAPHFMAPTVCSRGRELQNVATQMPSRTKPAKPGTAPLSTSFRSVKSKPLQPDNSGSKQKAFTANPQHMNTVKNSIEPARAVATARHQRRKSIA